MNCKKLHGSELYFTQVHISVLMKHWQRPV